MAGLKPSTSAPVEVAANVNRPPLILDLDGTLIRNDLTLELLLLCARWKPLLLIRVLMTAISDRSRAKRLLTAQFAALIDPDTLPYEPVVKSLAASFQRRGHAIELVSGSDKELVEGIARHNGIEKFNGSTSGNNLTASQKARFLVNRHGDNFLYVGNSKSDFPVWRAGQGGFGVNAPPKSYRLRHADGSRIGIEELVSRRSEIRPLLKSMRLHQWVKNLLLFVVPATQIISLDLVSLLDLMAAFVCFSLLASATYILNDLFDIQDDRRHSGKRTRPLASGLLSVSTALSFVVCVIPLSLAASFLINTWFGTTVAVYLAITTLYSFRLKRIVVIDVFTLASLYSIRVIAGAYVVGFPPSGWLLTFIGSFFLSLAIGKRFIELHSMSEEETAPGRDYVPEDAIPLLTIGASTGIISVLAMLMYGLSAPVTVFNFEPIVLAGCGLLFAWIMRFWVLAGRKQISDDPVIYAMRDRTSCTILNVIALLFMFDLTSPLWTNPF